MTMSSKNTRISLAQNEEGDYACTGLLKITYGSTVLKGCDAELVRWEIHYDVPDTEAKA